MEDEELTSRLFGDVKIPFSQLMKRIFVYIKPNLWKFILAFVLIIFNIALDTITPKVTQIIVDEVCKDPPVLEVIIIWAVASLGIALVNQGILYCESMLLQKTGQDIVYDLRMQIFEHIENMSSTQLAKMPVGSLVTRVASYTTSMSDLFTSTLVNMLRNILTVFAVFGYMCVMSWQLSLLMLPIIAVVFVASFIFSKVITKIFRQDKAATSSLNAFLNESISLMKIVQIFNQQPRKRKEFIAKNQELKRIRYKLTLAFGLYRPFINFIYYCSLALVFVCAVQFEFTAGTVVAFYLLIARFFNPIQNLADQLNNIQKATTASERLFNLLDVKPDVLDKEDALEIDHFKGKIEFKNVWFAYNKEHWILQDVSFVVNPGDTVAFVGATGAGKTTILSLIVRNYEIQKGQILIDDIDIKDIQIKSLRRGIGQMLQDVFLFSGTVRSNITLYDDENYSDEEIYKTCDYVNATGFINSLPNKLDDEVIERGENYSTGQRQLLSFARTVLAKPQILILDEATANIDTETESLIQDSLKKMSNIGTMLVVAHRLSTIQHADNIIVLQDGKILEQGKHQELLKKKGHYYKLYELQFNKDNIG